MAKRTCLHDIHVELGGRIVDFAGWDLPVQFEGILAEHTHTREHVSLFDTGHMGQLLISGPGVGEQLAAALSQDAVKLPVGRAKYGFLLTEAGTIIDDTILKRLGEDEFFLVVNAATAAIDAKTLRARLSDDIEIVVLASWGKLDVQGPEALDVLQPITEIDLTTMGYFGVCRTQVLGHDCILSRTGYTGELGWEIYMSQATLPEVCRALLESPNVKPAGLGARDSLRLEMGYALYGHELSQDVTPVDAAMEFFFDAERDFVGATALRTQISDGTNGKLVMIDSAQRRRFNTGDTILSDGEEIGIVTSGVFGPSLGRVIGMGFVRPEFTQVGTELTIATARAEITATVGQMPLYKDGTCRKKLS
ncbi:MAG: glycine cleavage system aminomethyltransferase GcvT [Phycisphaerales bacterium]|nr:glycine cleavage system aminomethyltransferase GcvT [Phycisphaerales bacterium]